MVGVDWQTVVIGELALDGKFQRIKTVSTMDVSYLLSEKGDIEHVVVPKGSQGVFISALIAASSSSNSSSSSSSSSSKRRRTSNDSGSSSSSSSRPKVHAVKDILDAMEILFTIGDLEEKWEIQDSWEDEASLLVALSKEAW